MNTTKFKTRVVLKTLKGKEYTMPKVTYYHLKECKNRVNQKLDGLIILTGDPGSGKSNLGKGMTGTWEEHFHEREFTLDHVHFRAEKIIERTNLSDNQTEGIDFDEAVQGGSGRDGNSKIGKILRKALITKRKKRHLYVISVDSLKELSDKIIERSVCWYHVYYRRDKNGNYRKGLYKVFNPIDALKVYLDLKEKKYLKTEDHPIYKRKMVSYNCMNYENLWFPEEEYDLKKDKETDLLEENDDKVMEQRNKAIMFALENGAKQQEVANYVGLSRSAVRDIKGKMAAA
jgi:hypothetical protein